MLVHLVVYFARVQIRVALYLIGAFLPSDNKRYKFWKSTVDCPLLPRMEDLPLTLQSR